MTKITQAPKTAADYKRENARTVSGKFYEGMKAANAEEKHILKMKAGTDFTDIDTDKNGVLSFEEIMEQRSSETLKLGIKAFLLPSKENMKKWVDTRMENSRLLAEYNRTNHTADSKK